MTERVIKFYKYCDTAMRHAKKQCISIDNNDKVIVELSVIYNGYRYSDDWIFALGSVGGIDGILLSGNVYDKIKRNAIKNRNFVFNWEFEFKNLEEVTVSIIDICTGDVLGQSVRKNNRGDKNE